MSEFEDRLNSILNDPAQMEQITAMAKSLMSGGEEKAAPPKGAGLLEGLDLGRLMASVGSGKSDDKQVLLEAMKPYLSPHRREKLTKAMKLAKMIGMAEIAFGIMGGDHAEV